MSIRRAIARAVIGPPIYVALAIGTAAATVAVVVPFILSRGTVPMPGEREAQP